MHFHSSLRFLGVALSMLLASACSRTELVDQGNGILKDSKTGLEWTQQDNGADINWNDAKNYCEHKGSGWRLPSVDELAALYGGSSSGTSCGHGNCKVSELFRLSHFTYWSGTEKNSSEVWYVNFVSGDRISDVVGGSYGQRALCVQHQ